MDRGSGRGWAVVLILAPGAGCLAGDDDAPAPRTFEWGLTDCAFVIAETPVDPARLAPYLPENFTASRISLLPDQLAGSNPAYLSFDAYRCREGVGLAGPVADLSYGSIYTGVAVPDELRVAGYDLYFVKWDPLIPDEDRRAAFAAFGIPARAGAATVGLTGIPGSGFAVEADVTLEGVGGFAIRGLTAAPTGGSPLPFMEYTPLEGGGLAQWRARLHDHLVATGIGTVQLEPGTWAAEVLGADLASVQVVAGAWNLDEASVTSPYVT